MDKHTDSTDGHRDRTSESNPLRREARATSDHRGNLVLPLQFARFLGVSQGADLRLVMGKDRIQVFPNIHSLNRLYIEPTSACNLSCQTCVRNTWDEPVGEMSLATFDRLVDQLQDFEHLNSVMFGGIGEPTIHRHFLFMVHRLKSLGLTVELTTNGTLLDEALLRDLLAAGLDVLWVSFDGTRPDTFDAVRGASFDRLVRSLRLLKTLNTQSAHTMKVGIAFVVTKNNLNDLPNLSNLAQNVGAQMVSVSNVIPYTRDMLEQMVCRLALTESIYSHRPGSVSISLPRMDVVSSTKDSLHQLLRSNKNVSVLTNPIGAESNCCRFIRERCTFVRWDGAVSPCMGLLHSYTTYLGQNQPDRKVTGYVLGNIQSESLKKIWESQEYHDFRDRVEAFDFSPCSQCGGCDFSESNREDCFGNTFPTCGGCLWAQGIVQCP